MADEISDEVRATVEDAARECAEQDYAEGWRYDDHATYTTNAERQAEWLAKHLAEKFYDHEPDDEDDEPEGVRRDFHYESVFEPAYLDELATLTREGKPYAPDPDDEDPVVAYMSPQDSWICLACAEDWDPSRGALTPVPLSEEPGDISMNVSGVNFCGECGEDAFGAYRKRV